MSNDDDTMIEDNDKVTTNTKLKNLAKKKINKKANAQNRQLSMGANQKYTDTDQRLNEATPSMNQGERLLSACLEYEDRELEQLDLKKEWNKVQKSVKELFAWY
jgi:hypothetical protein